MSNNQKYMNQERNVDQMGSDKRSEVEQKPIPINGFKQVLDMLKIADPAFRESLLNRLAQRDSTLASSLRRDLRK